MKLVAGDMLWTSVDRINEQYSYLNNHIECDVLIIGGGITGAITAYYLTKAGINTVIVEKNRIGYGSTRASTSILQYEIDTDLNGLSAMVGEENAVNAFKLCEQAVYDIEKIIGRLDDKSDFELKECLYYTDNPSEVSALKKEYDLRKKHEFDVEFLDREQAKSRFTLPIEGGIYSRKGAAQIDPYRFTHALIRQSLEQGLTVFENTEIDSILPQENYVMLQTTNNFNIKAKKVIIATGYEAKKYFNKKIATFSRTFTIVTKPVNDFSGWYNTCIIRDNKHAYNYLRTTGEGRIIFGGEDEGLGKESSKMSNLSNNDLVSKQKYEILFNKLKLYFPEIKDIEVDYKFSGIFATTKDGLPYIGGYEQMPNCYFNLGYGSNGILYALLGGQLLTDLCLGKGREELKLFRLNR